MIVNRRQRRWLHETERFRNSDEMFRVLIGNNLVYLRESGESVHTPNRIQPGCLVATVVDPVIYQVNNSVVTDYQTSDGVIVVRDVLDTPTGDTCDNITFPSSFEYIGFLKTWREKPSYCPNKIDEEIEESHLHQLILGYSLTKLDGESRGIQGRVPGVNDVFGAPIFRVNIDSELHYQMSQVPCLDPRNTSVGDSLFPDCIWMYQDPMSRLLMSDLDGKGRYSLENNPFRRQN